MYDPRTQKLIGPFCEVIDWLVTRSERGIEGPKVARTIMGHGHFRAYWFEGYLAYAPNEEFPDVSSMVVAAIESKYPDWPRPVYFEKGTIYERSPEE